jgi:hypothetical protein
MGKFVRAVAGSFDKQEPEPELEKDGPALQHYSSQQPLFRI